MADPSEGTRLAARISGVDYSSAWTEHEPTEIELDVSFTEDEPKHRDLPPSSRYQLLHCIASGGMGAVYIGVQRGAAGFERPVAIKRTHAHLLAEPEIRDAILREARNASAVRHPNVVSIDDVDEVDGELLLVMDYIDGGSLSQLVTSDHEVPLGVKLSIVLDACAGLSAIHTARDAEDRPLGLVHRDVSPQNILVGLDGVARVTDFGIAKGAADPKRTSKMMRRGKLGYMSPEYLLSGTATMSSDVFALGVVLWEALARRRLFKGVDHIDTLRLTALAEVPSLRTINPDITTALDDVVRRALARSPADRFRSMAEFGFRLEAATQGLVCSRAEVAEHVLRVFGPRRSFADLAKFASASAMELSGEDLVEDSESSSPKRPSVPVTAIVRTRATTHVTPTTPTARMHRAFRLEHALNDDVNTGAPGLAPTKRPDPIAVSGRRSHLELAALIIFVAAVIALTAVAAYSGLSSANEVRARVRSCDWAGEEAGRAMSPPARLTAVRPHT